MPCTPYIPAELPPRVGFLAVRSTNLSIPDAAATPVTLPTESFDSNAFFTPGASSGTVPSGKAGLYAITIQVEWSTSALGTSPFIQILASGVSYTLSGPFPNGEGGLGITIPLAVSDTIALNAYQNSGGAINLTEARLSAYLIGL